MSYLNRFIQRSPRPRTRSASRNPGLDGCVRDALDQGWASTVPQAYQYCSQILSIPTPNAPPNRRAPQYAMGARVPEGVMLATADTRPSPGRQLPPTLDACIEVIRNSNAVRVIFKNGEVWTEDYGWVLSGNTYTIDGQVHHEILNSIGATEGNPTPHIVPLCLIEGTFRPIGTSGTTPTSSSRPDILAACLEFIPMGNGAFRVVFENGDAWEPEAGWVLSGNKVTIDGVVHFEIINSIGAIEGQPNPRLIPLCIRESAPEPVTVFSPPTRQPPPPAVFSPPTRQPPTPTRPDPRGPATPPHVPSGPCDEYGNVSFIQLPGGSMGPYCE
jgi:hypothetical protein